MAPPPTQRTPARLVALLKHPSLTALLHAVGAAYMASGNNTHAGGVGEPHLGEHPSFSARRLSKRGAGWNKLTLKAFLFTDFAAAPSHAPGVPSWMRRYPSTPVTPASAYNNLPASRGWHRGQDDAAYGGKSVYNELFASHASPPRPATTPASGIPPATARIKSLKAGSPREPFLGVTPRTSPQGQAVSFSRALAPRGRTRAPPAFAPRSLFN